MKPESRGASTLYFYVFKPFYEKHRRHIFLQQLKSFFEKSPQQNMGTQNGVSRLGKENTVDSRSFLTPASISSPEQELIQDSISLPSSPTKYFQQKRRSLVGVGTREPIAPNSLFIHGLITNAAESRTSSPFTPRKESPTKESIVDRKYFEEFLSTVGTKNISAENLDVTWNQVMLILMGNWFSMTIIDHALKVYGFLQNVKSKGITE